MALLAMPLAPGSSWGYSNPIRVGVAVGVSRGVLGGSGTASDPWGSSVQFSGPVEVSCGADGLLFQGRFLRFPVRVVGSELSFNRVGYRGSLEILGSGGSFTVVNVLDLEDYLRGIIKMEANPAWPMEFLKAQAVVSRTYALRNLGRHRSQGFDLCAVSHCQLYRGRNAEDSRTDQAVESTRGMVLTYGGALAVTPFHADSGGQTAAASNVWGGTLPYLVSRPEPVSYSSPYSFWRVSLSSDQIERALRNINRWVGRILDIRVLSRDGGGRITSMEIQGSNGRTRLSGHEFRMAVGSKVVRSTNFMVAGTGSGSASPPTTVADGGGNVALSKGDDLLEMAEQGIFNRDEIFDMIMNPSKREVYRRVGQERASRPTQQAPMPTSGATPRGGSLTWTFEGRGWGHGVGMSQWGAKALAEAGWTFEQILMYYYPGTSIGRR